MGKGFGKSEKNSSKISKQTRKNYKSFFLNALTLIGNHDQDTQRVKAFIEKNLDKLNPPDQLIEVINTSKIEIFIEGVNSERKKEDIISCLVNEFSNFILNLDSGIQANNIEIALAGHHLALAYAQKSNSIYNIAAIKSNLGGTYLYRVFGDKVSNLNLAYQFYQEALEFFEFEKYPQQWAEQKLNLSEVHRRFLHGDKIQNQVKSLSLVQEALKVFTYKDYPEQWGACNNNLGNIYVDLIIDDKKENLKNAINFYEKALLVRDKKNNSSEWAETHNNLANAYGGLIKVDQPQKYLDLALLHYDKTLEVCTKQEFPYHWATTQTNIGSVYVEFAEICQDFSSKNENLQKAFYHHQKSLEILSYDNFPYDWATAQYNIGKNYKLLQDNLKSYKAFESAFFIYNNFKDDSNILLTTKELGDLSFKAQQWQDAIDKYSLAIEAVEKHRIQAVLDQHRQYILAAALDVYIGMIQACVNAGKIEKAIETVERSRSKRLVDLMVSNDLYSEGKIHPKVDKYLKEYDQLQEQIDRERLQNQTNERRKSHRLDRVSLELYTDTIQNLENRKQQIWQKIRKHDPVLAGEIQVNPPNLAAIQKLIEQPTTAILSFFTTNTDTQVFVVRKDRVTLHTCTGEGIETFQDWIGQNWLKPYVENKLTWNQTTHTFLAEVSKRLQISQLIEQHLEQIKELIIVPHLLLHQIPLAALPVNHEEYLGDKFLIRYTPSCQILEFCHQRPEIKENWQYGIVENATGDLPCASIEGNQLAQRYKIPENLHLGEKKATCANYRELAQQVQVLHSCHHAQYSLKDPLNSALQLADGNITLGQLMTPGWRLPNLSDVFLSCCETGLGLPDITDDVLTLASGFLCAGARSVISTLWSVDDLATTLFSGFYYQYRQAGKSRTEALQQAQIKLRSHNIKDLANDLTIILEQVKTKRNQANREMKKHDRNSTEASQLMEKYIRYDQVIKQIKTLMKQSPETCPFAHPQYWSAFTCQGLH